MDFQAPPHNACGKDGTCEPKAPASESVRGKGHWFMFIAVIIRVSNTAERPGRAEWGL